MYEYETAKLIDGEFPVSTPEEQGIPSKAIADFFVQVKERGLEVHALEIVRHGHYVLRAAAAPYETGKFHRILSAAKGILTTAILFAIQEGKLSLDDRLVDIFPDDVPGDMDPNMRKVRLYDLMNMATGHDRNVFYEMRRTDNWIKGFFSIPLTYEPGTVYVYNNGAPHIVAQVIKKIYGMDVPEFLKPRFSDPLGIEILCDYQWLGQLEPTTMCLTAEGMTRFALFYLQEGAWEGKQLLDAELVRMVGKRNVPTADFKKPVEQLKPGEDLTQSHDLKKFGFGLYGTPNYFGGKRFSGGRTNQAMYFPEEDMVISLLCNDTRTAEIMDIVKNTIYTHCYTRPVPEMGDGKEQLKKALVGFNLAPAGAADSLAAKAVSGRTYRFGENEFGLEEMTFRFENGCAEMAVRAGGETKEAVAGLNGTWFPNACGYVISEPESSLHKVIRGYTPDVIMGEELTPVHMSGAWVAENVFVFHQRSAARMCTIKYTCTFTAEGLKVEPYLYHLPTPPKEQRKIVLIGK